MDRRRFLLAVAAGLAGCGGRRAPRETLTPAPLPEEPTATPEPRPFADADCPTLDGPTTCAHTQDPDADLRVETDRETVSTTGRLFATLSNRGDRTVRLAPGRWGVWVREERTWLPVGGGPGGEVLPLAPGDTYGWLFLLGDRQAYSELDTTVGRLDLRPGRYAVGLPTESRTYAVLFDVVETEIRTPGNGSVARLGRRE